MYGPMSEAALERGLEALARELRRAHGLDFVFYRPGEWARLTGLSTASSGEVVGPLTGPEDEHAAAHGVSVTTTTTRAA